MKSANYSTIKIRHQTHNQFYVQFENSFFILPDGKTIVGPDGSDWNKLIVEDITLRNPTQIGTHGCSIITVLWNSLTQSLLVGDLKDEVKQYKKVNHSFTMIKDYGYVGVDRVFSSTQLGRLAIFGGGDRSLVVIDTSEQRICPGRLKSPFLKTYSLQICEGVGSKVYLSLGGYEPEYSWDASDFLDVTLLYNGHVPKNQFYEKMIKAQGLLQEKDEIINSFSLKIKQLESSLQKQSNQNKGRSNPKKSETKTSRFKSKMNYYNPRTIRCPETSRKNQKIFSLLAINSTKWRTNYENKNLKTTVQIIHRNPKAT